MDPTTPLISADLPGLGGRIKVALEDFEVEEIPAYEPSGSGDFLYLWIEKRDMGAEYFARQVAKRLDIPVGEVGTAGLKDRRAVTRQMVSVPAVAEPRLGQLEGDGIRVLNVSRHTNKLRPGHLHGNRFKIVVRELDAAARPREILPALLERIGQQGFPNYYGPQRFGRAGETLDLGLALLRGEKVRIRSSFLRKLALSAAQSALFNHCLAGRVRDGLFRKVLAGDVMAKIPFGGMFVAEDVEREQQRFDAREIVTAGPIFGRKTFPSAGDATQREADTLAAFALERSSFDGFGKLLQGTRRHNVVYPAELAADIDQENLTMRFVLPAGCYATVLLREFTKCEFAVEDDTAG